jgi:hypothetical protein
MLKLISQVKIKNNLIQKNEMKSFMANEIKKIIKKEINTK